MARSNAVFLDFDGVLAQYSGFEGEKKMGCPYPGALDFVNLLMTKKFIPVVFTTRKPRLVKKWLNENKFPKLMVTNFKFPAKVYIDDRSLQFTSDYKKLRQDLKAFDVHWGDKNNKIFNNL